MASKIDAFLKISIAAGVILASSSAGYYFAVYLPHRDEILDRERKIERAKVEYSRQADQVRIAAEKAAQDRRQAVAAGAIQAQYRSCVADADSNYSAGWALACKRIAEKTDKDRADCMLTAMKDNCAAIYKREDGGPSCSLPRQTGTDLDQRLEKARGRCLDESRAGLQ